jgi:hypothetical protein
LESKKDINMAGVKPLDRIREKWKRVSSAAQAEYEAGVKNPRTDWATATKGAEEAYKKGVMQAAAAGRFGKGVSKSGTSHWQEMAIKTGPHRWSEGIGVAEERYAAGFRPYHEALEALVYPAKGPKGAPENINRVAVVAKKLHELKLSLKGTA